MAVCRVKKVIVLGGSAGGITALRSILSKLPADFPAPILAVIHLANRPSVLAKVLQPCTRLRVVQPEEPLPLRASHVYIGPPNRHLIVEAGCVLPVMGPRENRHRPAVDTLFRSAARAYRDAVVAVIVSGALDDGSAGAMAVKARGGAIIVQDAEEAEFSDMPFNAARMVKPDFTLTVAKIPATLIRLASRNGAPDLAEASPGSCAEASDPEPADTKSSVAALTCPECGGALKEQSKQWRCHVGHRYTFDSLSVAHGEAVERAVWEALRKLKERQTVQERLARDLSLPTAIRQRSRESGEAAAHDIRLLEEILSRL